EKGLSLNDNLIKSGNSKFNSGFNLARELYEEDVTALFIANNLMTIGDVTFFKEQEINIPEEIALIGFDDYEWAMIKDPPLSTIKQPSNEIGKKAAEILLKKLYDSKNKTVKNGKLSLIIIVFVALTACNSNSNGGSCNTDSDKYNFAFLPNTQNNSFQTAMTQRFEELSKEEDFDFTMLDPDYDLNEQLSQMSDAANQKFDAVFIIPVDSSGIRQGLEQLNDMNIPVFNVDTAVTEEDRDLVESVIATDAFMAGQLMGEQMVQN